MWKTIIPNRTRCTGMPLPLPSFAQSALLGSDRRLNPGMREGPNATKQDIQASHLNNRRIPRGAFRSGGGIPYEHFLSLAARYHCEGLPAFAKGQHEGSQVPMTAPAGVRMAKFDAPPENAAEEPGYHGGLSDGRRSPDVLYTCGPTCTHE